MTNMLIRTVLASLVAGLLHREGTRSFTLSTIDQHNCSYWVHARSGQFFLQIAPHGSADRLFYWRIMMRKELDLDALI